MNLARGSSYTGRISASGPTYRGIPVTLLGSFELGVLPIGFLARFFETDEFSPGVKFGGCAVGGVDGGYGAVFLGYAT